MIFPLLRNACKNLKVDLANEFSSLSVKYNHDCSLPTILHINMTKIVRS